MLSVPSSRSLHLAVIPDGNGRWARARGKPRSAGHRAGLTAVRRIVAAAPELHVGILTIFALSSDNWQRPAAEVNSILGLLQEFLAEDRSEWVEHGVRVQVLGRRDRLPTALRAEIQAAEEATRSCGNLRLRLAVDYSGRESLLRAACRFYTSLEISQDAFAQQLATIHRCDAGRADVDLLIRTGGEQRLSDFLLWECAYAELYFSPKWWPDFDEADLAAALEEYHGRARTFGRLKEAV